MKCSQSYHIFGCFHPSNISVACQLTDTRVHTVSGRDFLLSSVSHPSISHCSLEVVLLWQPWKQRYYPPTPLIVCPTGIVSAEAILLLAFLPFSLHSCFCIALLMPQNLSSHTNDVLLNLHTRAGQCAHTPFIQQKRKRKTSSLLRALQSDLVCQLCNGPLSLIIYSIIKYSCSCNQTLPAFAYVPTQTTFLQNKMA